MTATPKELAHAGELRNALSQLAAAALAARPIVRAEVDRYLGEGTDSPGFKAAGVLDCLDCALADAGEVLARAAS